MEALNTKLSGKAHTIWASHRKNLDSFMQDGREKMRRIWYWLGALTLGAILIVWLGIAVYSQGSFRYPEGEWGTGRLRYVQKIPVLEVSGTPEEMGAAVARLGTLPAQRLQRYPRELFFTSLPSFLTKAAKEKIWKEVLASGDRLIANMPERHRREYLALREQLPEDWQEGLLAGNTLFDIKRLVHCSAVIVRNTGKNGDAPVEPSLLFGRNLDFPTLGYLHQYGLVLIYKPQGHYAFAAVGFPGMVGVLSGMNEHGLCVAMLEVYESGDGSPSFDAKGVPYAVALRRLLEECRTVEEARRLLKTMPRTCYFNVAICDTESGGVLEVSPKQVCFRGLENGICACTNEFHTEQLRVSGGKNWYRSRERLRELLALSGEASVGIEQVQRALHRANLGRVTLQTMIFEPKTLRLHLAMGSCPSSALPLESLDLEPFFKAAEHSQTNGVSR